MMTYTRLTKLILVLFTILVLSDAYPLHIRQRIRRAIKAPAGKLLAPLPPAPAPAPTHASPTDDTATAADTDDTRPKGLIAAEKLVLGKFGSAKGKWITVYEESGERAAKVTDRPAGTLLAPLPDSTPPPEVATPPPAAGGSGADDVARRWLELHNDARRQYGAGDLRWNWQLVAKAKRNADLCTGDHSNAGENIAAASGDLSPEKSVTWWVNEAALYDWSRPGFADATGHFTQVVWKGTQQVGCYMTECQPGTVFDAGYGVSFTLTLIYDFAAARGIADEKVSYQATCEYHPAVCTLPPSSCTDLLGGLPSGAIINEQGNYVNPGEFEKNVGQQI